MVDASTPIIEDNPVENFQEPVLETKVQSVLCTFGRHRMTRWSKPFSRSVTGFEMFTGKAHNVPHWFQARECLGCGKRQERSLAEK